MPVYKRILVALDCSPVDETILEHVSALALPLGSTLYLLHVVHSHTLEQERCLREQSVMTLDGYLARLQSKGVEARLIIRSGEPEREILQEIDENAYDLLAMALHGHRLAGRILFGSVSRTLREKVSLPLLLVKQNR